MKPRIKKYPLLWECSDGECTAVGITALDAYFIWKSLKNSRNTAVAYLE